MAFCHIKFQSIPLLMPFTLIDNPQFYCLEMSLSNILMIGLFRSNNRMVIFSKIEKEFIWQQTCKGPYIYTFMFHMEGVWPRGGLKFVTCLLILLFLNRRSVVRFWRWNRERSAWRRGWGVAHYAVKMILACGLMLKKKLLSLMIELVVYLNHFGVIHLWRWQKKLLILWFWGYKFIKFQEESFSSFLSIKTYVTFWSCYSCYSRYYTKREMVRIKLMTALLFWILWLRYWKNFKRFFKH